MRAGRLRAIGRKSTPFLLAATWALATASSAARGKDTGKIEFHVVVSSTHGRVPCGLFQEKGWLRSPVRGVLGKITPEKTATCVFTDVKPGVYAISAFHDENQNNDLDRNFLGIPKEDWCTSRNAKGIMGPPKFADAKFQFTGKDLVFHGDM